jgi:hypothetical protein
MGAKQVQFGHSAHNGATFLSFKPSGKSAGFIGSGGVRVDKNIVTIDASMAGLDRKSKKSGETEQVKGSVTCTQ